MDVRHKRTLILGLGREGASLAHFLGARGARVIVTDAAPRSRLAPRVESLPRDARIVAGGDHPELVDEADLLFVSPGVPQSNPVYRAAVARGMPIESMTTLFFALCPAPIIGITGSSGKTTTTSLVGRMLAQAGMDVLVGGNIGDPMLDLLPRVRPGSTVVLELSSFQLQLLRRSPAIAVVTNISPNHLDRHGTVAEYIAAKLHIVAHQRPSDVAVLNGVDSVMPRFATATVAELRWFGGDHQEGAFVVAGDIVVRRHGSTRSVLPIDAIPLIGAHNVENVLAACAVADVLGAPPAAVATAIRDYRPPPHRLEPVASRRAVRFVDDSIATTPARSMVALRALTEPVVMIAGGRDKHLPWDEWADLVVDRVRALVLIGEAAPLIEGAVRAALDRRNVPRGPDIHQVESLAAAVRCAASRAEPGDTVLLSPGCASYDMFTDYHERGVVFARAVEDLDAA